MQIQVNTDRSINGHEALAAQVGAVVESALTLVSHRVTRVEVHLSDESAKRSGERDKRCVMEARIEGWQPLAVTHQAANVDLAVEGAAGKLARLIVSTLDRVRSAR